MKIKTKKLFEYFKFSRYAIIENENIIFIKKENLKFKKIELLEDNDLKENFLIYFNNKIKKELNHIKEEMTFSIKIVENNKFLKIKTSDKEILIELIKTVVKI
jgi:hypothetical protein